MSVIYDTESTVILNGLDVDALLKFFKDRKKRLEQMPKEEAEKEVKGVMFEAGIIDHEGNLKEPYRTGKR